MKTVSVQQIVVVFLLLFSFSVSSQDLDSLLQLGAFTQESALQKDLNKDVSVAAVKLASRESPGIVTVINSNDIVNSGARDLTDVLRLVPGFDVLQDLQFVQGLGLRGSWANEGKVLVMLDGVPMNDLLYQVVAVGNRFPADAIERIEIIRGPGSAIYGGSAEYGVINIISKATGGLNGVSVFHTTGLHKDGLGRMNFGATATKKGENYSWYVSANKGMGNVSNQKVESPDGNFDLKKTTEADPLNATIGMDYKGLSFKSMYDEYKTGDPYSNISFKSTFVSLQYQFQVNNKFSLTPKVQYQNQLPWYVDEKKLNPGSEPIFDYRATRTLGQLDAIYSPSRKSQINFGTVFFQDASTDRSAEEQVLTLNNFAFYAQGLFKHRLANATIGFRYEKNNRYSGAFVPRIALTKKIEDFHFKLLYSKSFRAPSLQNFTIALNDEMKPEKSNVFEIELGYQFTPEMLLAVNAYHISTRDVIIYGSEGDGDEFNEWYENYAKSGSKGVELVYSLKKTKWSGQLTYTYQQTIDGNTVDKFVVPQTTKQYAGMPLQKVTMNLNYAVSDRFNLNTSLIQAGARYAYTYEDEAGPVAERLAPYTQWNFFTHYTIAKGFRIGAGVYDILNAKPGVPQAYNGGVDGVYPPIPGRSREYILKLSYQFNRNN